MVLHHLSNQKRFYFTEKVYSTRNSTTMTMSSVFPVCYSVQNTWYPSGPTQFGNSEHLLQGLHSFYNHPYPVPVAHVNDFVNYKPTQYPQMFSSLGRVAVGKASMKSFEGKGKIIPSLIKSMMANTMVQNKIETADKAVKTEELPQMAKISSCAYSKKKEIVSYKSLSTVKSNTMNPVDCILNEDSKMASAHMNRHSDLLKSEISKKMMDDFTKLEAIPTTAALITEKKQENTSPVYSFSGGSPLSGGDPIIQRTIGEKSEPSLNMAGQCKKKNKDKISVNLVSDHISRFNNKKDFENASCPEKFSVDRSSVLFERKCKKKGRPSSKKQNKRKREKKKQADKKPSREVLACQNSVTNITQSSKFNLSMTVSIKTSSKFTFEEAEYPETQKFESNSVNKHLSSLPCAEVKTGSFAAQFFFATSDSDSESDSWSDSEEAMFSDCDFDWSDEADRDNSLIEHFDNVFLCSKGQNLKLSTLSNIPSSKENECFSSIESSFTDDIDLKNHMSCEVIDNEPFDIHEPAEDLLCDLSEVNDRWRSFYSSSDVDKCCSTPKVLFANDADLVTVYFIEEEDRRGEWEMAARDRQRFNRRIQEISHIISPILSPSHRSKILKKNDCP